MRVLLISDSGLVKPARDSIAEFVGPARRLGLITAASLSDEVAYYAAVRFALAPAGLEIEHVRWDRKPTESLGRAEAILVGGGNTYVLLKRLRESGLLGRIKERVIGGTPYVGWSAGATVAGPTILATNDWNVVGLAEFMALGLVPFNINPHYKETDPAMAPGSETRDDRIREYHVVNANPVVGLEEGAMLCVDDAGVTVLGTGMAKVFKRGAAPVWHSPREKIRLP